MLSSAGWATPADGAIEAGGSRLLALKQDVADLKTAINAVLTALAGAGTAALAEGPAEGGGGPGVALVGRRGGREGGVGGPDVRDGGGELGTLSTTSIPNPAAFDTSLKRPKRYELTAGIDREIIPTVLASATFIYRTEKDLQTSIDQNLDLWDSLYTKVTLTDPGRDGVAGTSDDASIQVYNQNTTGTVNVNKTVNDDRLATKYKGLELTVTRRVKDGWTVLAGYTYSRTTQDFVSLQNPNAAYVNSKGESGGRRHNLKLSGTYTLPWQVVLGANVTMQSGLPITRTWAISACSTTVTSNCLRQAATVNAEARGRDLSPQSGAMTRRLVSTYGSARRMRSATTSGVSTSAVERSSTPRMTVRSRNGASTAGSRFGCAAPPPMSTVVMPASSSDCIQALPFGPSFTCLWPSMKPGATTWPSASISRRPRSVMRPIAAMRCARASSCSRTASSRSRSCPASLASRRSAATRSTPAAGTTTTPAETRTET